MKIIQNKNYLDLEYNITPRLIEIRYTGAFIGQIHGNNIGAISKNKFGIVFLTDNIQSRIMDYAGNLLIKSIKAYDYDNNMHYVDYIYNNDYISKTQTSTFSQSDLLFNNKIEPKNNTTANNTILTFNVGNENIYVDSRKKIIKENQIEQADMSTINKIRGTYANK
jgi:hypothetical protein